MKKASKQATNNNNEIVLFLKTSFVTREIMFG